MAIEFEKIGTIKTPYTDWAPQHPLESGQGEFVIELDEEFQEGLQDLDSFAYVHVLFHFDRSVSKSDCLSRPPWARGQQVGVFAARSPRRPNLIGLSVVRVIRIEGNQVFTSPLDVLDGTPLLDLKPYIKATDAKDDANNGWIETLGDAEHMLQHLRGVAHDHGDGDHEHTHHHGHDHVHVHEHAHGGERHTHEHRHHHDHDGGEQHHDHLDDPEHPGEPHDHEH